MTISPLPGPTNRPPQRIGTGIERVVASLGMPSVGTVRSVFGSWEDVVGPDVAQRCRPVGLRDGTLTVAAVDQAWATELRWMERQIIERCATEFANDDVRAIKVTTKE